MGGDTKGKSNLRRRSRAGFTLIEVLIGALIFFVFSLGIYQGYVVVIKVIHNARIKTTATLLANEQIELVHNLSYEDVGVNGGIPDGVIPFSREVSRGRATYTIKSTIRNIDDPFDGTIGGDPNDLTPADYKLVEFEISCDTCEDFDSITFTTTIAPKNLEMSAGNGALFVEVFNASGQPIQGVDVHIENNATVTPIIINEVTNSDGMLQLVDVPPGIEAYEVTVSKDGYSTAQTYTPGEPENPNPTKPHATVASGTVTQISFPIDLLGSLNIETSNNTCQGIGNVDFDLTGTKLIGTGPDVYKYEESLQTGAGGSLNITEMEWDTYTFDLTEAGYDIAGSIPFFPITVSPGASEDTIIVLESTDPNSLLVSVRDGGTQLPLSDVNVILNSTSTSYSETLITSRGYSRQTDWSGGDGQENFVDPTRYSASDGNIEDNDPAGDVVLDMVFDEYASSGYLISSTFDSGATSTTYHTIAWSPESQPPETGSDSVRFQVAANNDESTWNYYGPDGTSGTYYTTSDTTLNSVHDNNRYVRYKLYLSTASTTYTPNVSDVSITYGSECIPFGQVFFNDLAASGYELSASKTGYTTFAEDINVTSGWQDFEITLIPE